MGLLQGTEILIGLVSGSGRLKFWVQSSLFAEFVGCDSIKLSVPFDWNYLFVVCVNGMFTPFSKQIEAVLFQITD